MILLLIHCLHVEIESVLDYKAGGTMNSKKVGQFIALRRKELGMTQSQLAAKLNVSDGAVSKWERGINYPDIAMVEDLSAALDVTVMELLQGELSQDAAYDPQIKEAVHETLNYSRVVDSGKRKRYIRSIRTWQVLLVILILSLFLARPVLTIYQNLASSETYDRIMSHVEENNWVAVSWNTEYYLSHFYGASNYNEIKTYQVMASDKLAKSNFDNLMNRSGLTKGELETLFLVLRKVGVDQFGSVKYPECDLDTEQKFIFGYISDEYLGDLVVNYKNRTITRIAIAAAIFNGEEPVTYFTLYSDTDGFLLTLDNVRIAIDAYYAQLNK